MARRVCRLPAARAGPARQWRTGGPHQKSQKVKSNVPNGPRTMSSAGDTVANHGGQTAGSHLSLSGSGPGLRRSFVDPADGSRWTVVERAPSGEREDAPGRSLYFVSDGIFRRVRTYPAGWRDLPDAELAALSRCC
jgi:hypothetical protein